MQPANAMDQEFLPLRAKLIEIGAALDRLDRDGALSGPEPRVTNIRTAIQTLLAADSDRAERIQLVFSRTYDADWRRRFQIPDSE